MSRFPFLKMILPYVYIHNLHISPNVANYWDKRYEWIGTRNKFSIRNSEIFTSKFYGFVQLVCVTDVTCSESFKEVLYYSRSMMDFKSFIKYIETSETIKLAESSGLATEKQKFFQIIKPYQCLLYSVLNPYCIIIYA